MPLLNFQSQFANAVERGVWLRAPAGVVPPGEVWARIRDANSKTYTLRAFRKDGKDPKRGDMLHLYTGARTKSCRKLGEVICEQACPFVMKKDHIVITCPTGVVRMLSGPKLDEFAQGDGFTDWDEMKKWFESTHGLPFKGLLIEW